MSFSYALTLLCRVIGVINKASTDKIVTESYIECKDSIFELKYKRNER